METERPILYTEPMVQAKRKGIKSMTRRIRGKQLILINENLNYTWTIAPATITKKGARLKGYFITCPGIEDILLTCPYGQVGDILYGRETVANCDFGQGYVWCYRADQPDNTDIKWTPSIHMPKAAARIWDRITATRLERLQDITEADCKAEGIQIPMNNGVVVWRIGERIQPIDYMPSGWLIEGRPPVSSAEIFRAHYAALWDTINGKGSWAKNPYVWVIETEPVTQPLISNS